MEQLIEFLKGRGKTVRIIAVLLGVIILFNVFNPVRRNELGYRQVVQPPIGAPYTVFEQGVHIVMPMSRIIEWPNVMSVVATNEPSDASVVIDPPTIRFSDATEAVAIYTCRFKLPSTSVQMVKTNEEYGTPDILKSRSLKTFSIEAIQNSAALMSSEQHYAGGRAMLAQNFRDQLKNGLYLMKVEEGIELDTISGERNRVYKGQIIFDEDGQPGRKHNTLVTDFGFEIQEAVVTDVDYDPAVDDLIRKKVESKQKQIVAKENLITAQRETETAEAEGKKKLMQIEYEEKQKQTQQVVQAETAVKLAEQDRVKQKIALEASKLEAAKIKTLADANAYAKQKVMAADGALEMKLATYEKVQATWANALKDYKGSIVPSIQTGGGSGSAKSPNAFDNFMGLMSVKAAQDLNLDLSVKK